MDAVAEAVAVACVFILMMCHFVLWQMKKMLSSEVMDQIY